MCLRDVYEVIRLAIATEQELIEFGLLRESEKPGKKVELSPLLKLLADKRNRAQRSA